tara:strand:- start:7784 stop:8143 length:360 start_codon:yes stop_codon:yes gene_type:complete
MFRISIIVLVLFGLQSCASVKKLETLFIPAERERLNLEDPILPKLEGIKWIVITSKNAEEVFKKMEEEGIDPVLFGLSDNDYQLIAKNFAQIRHNLKTKSEIIKSYKDYYETDKPKGKE